jgi:hypothetical protein
MMRVWLSPSFRSNWSIFSPLETLVTVAVGPEQKRMNWHVP